VSVCDYFGVKILEAAARAGAVDFLIICCCWPPPPAGGPQMSKRGRKEGRKMNM